MQCLDNDVSLWSPLWIIHMYMPRANEKKSISRCFCVSVTFPLKTKF